MKKATIIIICLLGLFALFCVSFLDLRLREEGTSLIKEADHYISKESPDGP